MKWFVADYNGVLTDLKARLHGKLAAPAEADVWVVWQDCWGSYSDLIGTQKKLGINKPVFVVQHGGMATRDYGPPNKVPLLADQYLTWGEWDRRNLESLGYKDRAVIVGCPLNSQIQPKEPHEEKIVLFVPVNTGKEEPENIACFYELLKMKYDSAQLVVLSNQTALKDHWGFAQKKNVSFNELGHDFDVVAKLLPWHDRNLYHGNVITGYQDTAKNNVLIFELLRNVDAVVSLDESTTELFAFAHDVPVIVVDGFRFRQHDKDGKNFSVLEGTKTGAAVHIPLEGLQAEIRHTIQFPDELKDRRRRVAEEHLGLDLGDPIQNIISHVKKQVKSLLPIR